ncbi:MAG: copper resistance protein CopC [Actinomycetales bacterium]|nr:copper resistance protein CopC [Actinomycetales bacterium]
MTMRDARPRGVAALVVVLLALLGWQAAPASAHTELLSTTPAEGAVLATVPSEVDLTFSESVLPESVVVSVQDETGFVVRVLDLSVDGTDVLVTWPPGMRGKDYSVNYRVVSQDGHPVEGTLHFSVTSAPTDGLVAAAPTASAVPVPVSAPASSSSADDGGRALLTALIVGLVVGAVAGLVAVLVVRRSGRRRSASGTET